MHISSTDPIVVVSGPSGYLARHAIKYFIKHNFYVIGVTHAQKENIFKSQNYCQIYYKDFINLSASFKPFCFLHTATCYQLKNLSSSSIFDANYNYAYDLLVKSVSLGCKAFINIGTFFDQIKDPCFSRDYILSKRAFHESAQRFCSCSTTLFTTLYLHHVFGPNESTSKFNGWLVSQLLQNREIPLTHGQQYRDFIYIDDAISYISVIINRILSSPAINLPSSMQLGTGTIESLATFVELLAKCLGSTSKLDFGAVELRPSELLSVTSAPHFANSIGWSPSYNLYKGIYALSRYYT